MKHLTDQEVQELEDVAYQIKRTALEMIVSAKWGHIGGSFSIAEVLACLYFRYMNIDPNDPYAEDRDYFILSKAHASPALYAVLALKGFFPKDELYKYCTLKGLDGHTKRGEPAGIEFSGGSLGLGLSYAVGLALGAKMKEEFGKRIYCLLGDGETNEGHIWEAAMSASHYELNNLIAIVDYNKVGAKGFVHELMSVEPLSEKWSSFGWKVIEIDGHDIRETCSALYRAKYLEVKSKPICIISNTVKGRGIKECEFNYKWHTHAPDLEKAELFSRALDQYYDKPHKELKVFEQREEEESLEALLKEVIK